VKKLDLVRVAVRPEGAFGVLLDNGLPFAVTLEWTGPDLKTKIPDGTFSCVKTTYYGGGYTTFEVMNVPGHSRILFHKGNYEKDTEGCILVADAFNGSWISGSRQGFAKLMGRVGDRMTFDLVVVTKT